MDATVEKVIFTESNPLGATNRLSFAPASESLFGVGVKVLGTTSVCVPLAR